MSSWYGDLQIFPDNSPAPSVVMQPKDADKLLEVVVEDRVIHAGVNILKAFRDDRMSGNEV